MYTEICQWAIVWYRPGPTIITHYNSHIIDQIIDSQPTCFIRCAVFGLHGFKVKLKFIRSILKQSLSIRYLFLRHLFLIASAIKYQFVGLRVAVPTSVYSPTFITIIIQNLQRYTMYVLWVVWTCANLLHIYLCTCISYTETRLTMLRLCVCVADWSTVHSIIRTNNLCDKKYTQCPTKTAA